MFSFIIMEKESVSVVQCDSYELKELEGAIEKALRLINFKFKNGLTVLLKPNVLGAFHPDKGVVTNPKFVEAVCKILRKNKVKKIYIGDSSYQNTSEALKISGIADVAKKYKAELIVFETNPLVLIKDDEAKISKEFRIPTIFKNVDLIINLPKLKTHTLAKLTCAVKNLFGAIPGGRKQEFHRIADTELKFCELLIDIYQNIKPGLNILDGVIGMEGDGPSAGDKKLTRVILASRNAIALDRVACRVIGFREEEVLTNKIGVERGLCSREIEQIGERVVVKYKKPNSYGHGIPTIFRKIFHYANKIKVRVNKDKCSGCATCDKHCPVDAIEMVHGKKTLIDKKGIYPCFDYEKCIRCFCCMEVCPEHAIYLRESLLKKLYMWWVSRKQK